MSARRAGCGSFFCVGLAAFSLSAFAFRRLAVARLAFLRMVTSDTRPEGASMVSDATPAFSKIARTRHFSAPTSGRGPLGRSAIVQHLQRKRKSPKTNEDVTFRMKSNLLRELDPLQSDSRAPRIKKRKLLNFLTDAVKSML
jgi:hypothetical protein